jgi:hypothetical protein
METTMSPYRPPSFSETSFVVGAPLSLAILELFHPHPHDLFQLDLRRWLLVHYLQIPLFALAALATVTLVRARAGVAAAVCRFAMFLFVVTYIPFDTAAGIVTGVLVKAAQASGAPEAWREPVMAVWTHPIVGGASRPAPLLAVAGSIAWSLGTVAAAWTVRRAGSSWMPALLLAVSGFGLSVFRTHAWPGGPVTFGTFAAAAAWLQWEKGNQAKARLQNAGSEASSFF